jgi:hypothetical protein
MEPLIALLRELRELEDREEHMLKSVPDGRPRDYREGYRDCAKYAADALEEALEEMEA